MWQQLMRDQPYQYIDGLQNYNISISFGFNNHGELSQNSKYAVFYQ